jgi:hypothetical protein
MHRAVGLSLFLGCLASTCLSVLAAEPQFTRVLDKRRDKAVPQTYQLIFCARPTSVADKLIGHSWVFFIRGDASGPIESEAWGFWPADLKTDAALKLVPGELKDELLDDVQREEHKTMTCRLIVQVDEKDFNAARRRVQAWKRARPSYDLGTHNCNYFVVDIARTIDIVPADYEVGLADKPTTFLTNLIDVAK